jgi:hypothetical protein
MAGISSIKRLQNAGFEPFFRSEDAPEFAAIPL